MLTTDATIDEFTAFLSEKVPPSSQATLGAYRTDGLQLARYLDDRGMDWGDLTTNALLIYRDMLGTRGMAPVSVERKIASARSLCRFLVDQGVLLAVPAVTGYTTVRRPCRPLQPSDWAHLRRELARDDTPGGGRDRALIAVLAGTGWRIGRVLALDVEDADALPLDDLAYEALHEYLRHDRPRLTTERERAWRPAFSPALFVNHNGSRLTRQGAHRRFAELGAAAGVYRLRADLVSLSGQTSRAVA